MEKGNSEECYSVAESEEMKGFYEVLPTPLPRSGQSTLRKSTLRPKLLPKATASQPGLRLIVGEEGINEAVYPQLPGLVKGAQWAWSFFKYRPCALELSSGQALLLGLLHGLALQDLPLVQGTARAAAASPQLRSRHLALWLAEDFAFPQEQVTRALDLLRRLLNQGQLSLPSHVIDTLTHIGSKYGVSAQQMNVANQETERSLEEDLCRAVIEDSAGDTIALAVRGADVNWKTESGDSLLHIAVSRGCLEAMGALGYLKADIEARDAERRTPLHRAVMEDRPEAVRALLKAGADFKKRGKGGDTLLHLAATGHCNLALAALLEADADFLVANHTGETPLMRAIRIGNSGAVDMFLRAGADPNVDRICGKTLLEMAVLALHTEMVDTLLRGGADLSFTEDGDTLLHIAAHSGNEEVVTLILNAGSDFEMNREGLFPLHISSKKQVIKTLVTRGAQVNQRSTAGDTPLHLAAQRGCVEAVAALLEVGAELELEDCKGATALGLAANAGAHSVVGLLLAEGANPDVSDKRKSTPLHKAASAGCLTSVRLLLEAKAPVSPLDEMGLSPAHHAAMTGHLPVLLELVSYGATVLSGMPGNVVLQEAAYHGHADVVFWLLEQGTEVRPTVLHSAASAGKLLIVERLLEHGADINAKSERGQTPLHIAADKGHTATVDFLIKKGASVNVKDTTGKTPLDFARRNDHADIIELLKK